MRKYQEIWVKLLASRKKTLEVRCVVPRQDRLIKGVFKEKGLDLRNRTLWRMEVKKHGELLSFSLRQRVRLMDCFIYIDGEYHARN